MRTGVLIIHGFAGMRSELAPLKEHLEKRGFIVSMPLLAGHESTRKELAKSNYNEWIKSAEDAAKELETKCGKLIVIGFSMGGLIGVNLCRHRNVEKIVLINTPVYYWDIVRMLKNLNSDFKTYSKKYFTASTNKPLRALLSFQKLLNKTKPLFSGVCCPALIMQTLNDDTVNPKSADYIFQNIKSKKVLKKYNTGGHLPFETDTANHICLEIENFI